MISETIRKKKRAQRVRQAVKSQGVHPRLSIHKTNGALYAQIINDADHTTLVSASVKKNNTQTAEALGIEIAKKATEKGITKVVFDRGSTRYHGVIRALAEKAREGGLIF